jgi:hypothetical protein
MKEWSVRTVSPLIWNWSNRMFTFGSISCVIINSTDLNAIIKVLGQSSQNDHNIPKNDSSFDLGNLCKYLLVCPVTVQCSSVHAPMLQAALDPLTGTANSGRPVSRKGF